jgi:hypothetical protein
MRKKVRLFCSAFCFLSITLPGSVMATPLEAVLENIEEQAEFLAEEEGQGGECRLAFATGDFRLEPVSMEAGDPIGVLLLYVSDKAGKIIKDAQVITTIIDQQGNQQADRARPHKYGYMVAIDHLPLGQYRVETEIVTGGQLFTEEFMFNKA